MSRPFYTFLTKVTTDLPVRIRISALSELVLILPCLKQDGYTKLYSVYAAQSSGYFMLEYQYTTEDCWF